MQDYIAMVLLWYATQAMPGSRGGSDTPFLEALSRIEQQLDKAL
jgi:hypothetical protein